MQKMRRALVVLVVIVIVGTAGFMVMADLGAVDALYMTVITLSTVGFGEVTPLDESAKEFVILLILFGVSAGAYLVSVIGEIVLEGQLHEVMGRRKMEKSVSKLKDHFIIAGYGRVGRQVAREFVMRKAPFIVIEQDEHAAAALVDEGFLFVLGTATEDEVLRRAGIEKAHTLISTLPDEAHNVYLTLSARTMNKSLKIIARADFDDGEKKLKRAGADHVISPHVLGGQRMALASLRPNVVDFMHMTSLSDGGLSIEELIVPMGCHLAGKTLADSQLKQEYGINIIGTKKANEVMAIAPGPQTVLDAGDVMVVIGQTDDLERLSKELG